MSDQRPAPGSLVPTSPSDAFPSDTPGEADSVRALGTDQLGATLAAVLLGQHGVIRIEPTLIGVARSLSGASEPGQHLRLNRRGLIVDVTVNLAVSSDQQARTLAHRLRADLSYVITELGLTPGTIEISILAIEAPEADALT